MLVGVEVGRGRLMLGCWRCWLVLRLVEAGWC